VLRRPRVPWDGHYQRKLPVDLGHALGYRRRLCVGDDNEVENGPRRDHGHGRDDLEHEAGPAHAPCNLGLMVGPGATGVAADPASSVASARPEPANRYR
jgi:hypothetical protein